MATGISVVRNANLYTLTVNTGAKIEDIYIGKIAVEGNVGSGVIQIIYEGNLYVQGLYNQFIDGSGKPLGNSVATVEAAIAALLYLPGGGSGGSCCPIIPVSTGGTSVSILSSQFDGQTQLNLLSTTGTVAAQLPNPATVKVGATLRLSTVGAAGIMPGLNLLPFGSETLDGQSSGGEGIAWEIPAINYTVAPGQYLPPQVFIIYTDGTNWFSTL